MYIFSLSCISKTERYIYNAIISHTSYFYWLSTLGFEITTPFYKIKNFVLFILFVFLFPILSVLQIPIERLFEHEGELYILPIALQQDKTGVTMKMQSKLYWYSMFSQHNLNTPKVFYYKGKKLQLINEMSNDESIFIMKPEYGTEGAGVKKCSSKEFFTFIKKTNTNYILQEYVRDCFYENTRHFRINTTFVNGVTKVFSIDERKQIDNNKIASNHANGGNVTICEHNKCDFLSVVEQRNINKACKSFVKLHKIEFDVIPLIGCDVCLTCNGPYYFEGNIGAAITEEIYPKYMSFINELYNII